MENEAPGWIAAFWFVIGGAILASIQWIARRLLVPRDAVQRQYLETLKKDVDELKITLLGVDNKQARLGAEVAYLKGLLEGHEGR